MSAKTAFTFVLPACPKGFTSKARFACTPCLEGTYGFRCADNCQCQHSERCDHVNGCVARHEADTLSTENSFTRIIRTQNDVNNYQTSTIHMCSHDISERLRNQLHSTIWTSPKSKEDTLNGFIDQKVLTYMLMAVAGALVVVIGLCLCLICVCWKRHVLSKKRSIPSSSSAFPLTKFPDMEDDTLGAHETSVYGYEEIDEANMLHEIPVIQQDRISISRLQKDSGDSDGYLHPYHSLVSINSNSCKGLDDQQNTDISEERSYSELSAANQYLDLSTGNQHNNEVPQKESCEGVSEKDHETMYEEPVDIRLSGDKVVFF